MLLLRWSLPALLPALLPGCFWINASDHDKLIGGLGDEDGCHETSWYRDADGDGFGALDDTTTECDAPEGYVSLSTDCDDTAADVSPDGEELCNDIDDDCDGDVDEDAATDASTWYGDMDWDGFGDDDASLVACQNPDDATLVPGDCDDGDAAVNPDAIEVCNGVDDDCDSLTDDDDDSLDVSTADVWYLDADEDTYGDADNALPGCVQPADFVPSATDCDDADPAVNPAATEVCNAYDDDCDTLTDDEDSSLDASSTTSWFPDADSDGYGSDDGSSVYACAGTAAFPLATNTDCDDGNAGVNPGAPEVCNSGIDDDCDALVDDGDDSLDPATASAFYADVDADGFGSAASSSLQCVATVSFPSDSGTDCDDGNGAIHPAASEVCNSADDDCDTLTDDDDDSLDTSTQTLWYQDDDSDGVGKDDMTTLACVAPLGWVADGGDCNDDDSYVTDVDYQVSFVDSFGTNTDHTAALAAGTASTVASWSFPADGTLRICPGTWYATLVNSGYDVALTGYGGRENVVIDGDYPGSYESDVTSFGGTMAISGLTIAHGNANYGGGIYSENTDMTVDDCVVTGNYGYDGGGIATAGAGSFALSDSVISDNISTGSGGGGLFFWDQGTPPTITDCTITGNSARNSSGGGVFTYAYDTVIVGGEISDNTAVGYGAGVFFGCNAADGVVDGTLIADNTTTSYGGGVAVDCNITVTLTNTTITGNTAGPGGGGLALVVGNNAINIADSVVTQNTATLGGGAYVLGNSSILRCTGSSGSAGFWDNAATLGGGAYVDTGGYLDSTACDWDGTATNSPDDLYTAGNASSYEYGDDETFSCATNTGCI